MNDNTKNFLQDLFINVYNNDLDMYEELGTEENIFKLNDLVFGKMITIEEIEDCAEIIGNDDDAKVLAYEFVTASNKLENIFRTVLKTNRKLRKEYNH